MDDGLEIDVSQRAAFARRCLSLDLEVDPATGRLFAFAAVRPDDDQSFVFKRGRLDDALIGLDRFATDAEFLLGHNIIRFDLPHLAAASSGRAAVLAKPPIDTLWLNPLAFPKNPYHRLVKHYHDGRLKAGHVNDPELDARLVLEVLADQLVAMRELQHRSPHLLAAYHWLTTTRPDESGFDAVFASVRGERRPPASAAEHAIRKALHGEACIHQIGAVLAEPSHHGWPLAYALSWIAVAGGDSVMPPWVRHAFPEASALVRRLRDTPCDDPACNWCRTQNDPRQHLARWFGFPEFRSEPKGEDGTPLQEKIVAAVKGRKDRKVMLSPSLLALLRDYWREARPEGWLFPGEPKINPISPRQLNRAFMSAKDMAGIARPATAYPAPQLRHPPSGGQHRRAGHPGSARTRQVDDYRPVHPRRNQDDPGHRQPLSRL